jgi:glycosyltransferase involved in cell wall biosynthesis
VGGFGPHKHVDAAVRAHAVVARRAGVPLHLLLVGEVEDVFLTDRAPIDAAIEQTGTADLVHWTGFLPDDELRPLLAGATALVLPSEREGFGLPAVEAAACGTPVVATDRSPLPALLDGGGFFVEPGDEHALADALTKLVDDPALRRAMGERARARAGALSWSRAADAALDAIREAAR